MTTVKRSHETHRHASHATPEEIRAGRPVCRTACGIPCDQVDIVYSQDARPITCAVCAPHRECTPGEGQRWQAQHGDGYRVGAGDARADRAPRIQLIPVPAEIPGETGSRYVARHVAQAWPIGYTTGYAWTSGRAVHADCADKDSEVCAGCGGHCAHRGPCDHISRNGAN